ncbi:MAG TPA: sulfatase-like hydrolase/transferase [Balneolales bacterium]|nr:sulfatase-like hydrolase/transferase [Balneolales bacterium]
MSKKSIPVLLLLFCVAFFYSCKNSRNTHSSRSGKPNIIILFTDDMGYGDLQDYGNPNIRTPNIDRLADEGIRFTSYEAAPWCVPSRAELMTGEYIPRLHFGGGTGAGGHGGLSDSVLTLAEGLKRAGYATGMAGKWHLGYDPKKYLPTNRGFDSWLGLPYSNDYKKPYVQTDVPLVMYRDTTVVEYPVNEDSLTIKYTHEAIRFITDHSHGKQPFFFYLAYNMPHLPIHTTTQFLGKSGAGLYGDVVETIDWSVGKVMQTLKNEHLANNTIVFFASDNGPWNNAPPRMFRVPQTPPKGEHWDLRGPNKHWFTGSSGPLRGSKHTSWEGGTRVPAMIRWPGHIEPDQVSSELVTNLDMFRTFLTVGDGHLPDYPLDGYNMLPFFTGKSRKSPRKEYAYFLHGKFTALRVGKWKLKINDKYPELYNLQVDVSEKYNVADSHPDIVHSLRQKMDSIATRLGMNGMTFHSF